jgi:hypothetical protein
MRLMEPFMSGEVRRGEAKEALRLKELLEAELSTTSVSSTAPA